MKAFLFIFFLMRIFLFKNHMPLLIKKESFTSYKKFEKQKQCLLLNGLNNENFLNCFGVNFYNLKLEMY